MMDLSSVLAGTWKDGTRPADLYREHVSARPSEYVAAILAGIASDQKRVRAGCAELASLLSAEHPAILYPHVELFARNLKGKAPVLRWEAVCTIGNLASVDKHRITPAYVDELIAILSDKSIVLQGHAVRALGKIATHNPSLAPKILSALLEAERHFPGTRVGYLVEATELFAAHRALVPQIRRFLAVHAASERAPVARKAAKVLKKLDAASA